MRHRAVPTPIFGFFAVPPLYQHRVLFWGVLGALLMRGAMIGLGARLISEFHGLLYVFAIFLILTAIRMLFLKPNTRIRPGISSSVSCADWFR